MSKIVTYVIQLPKASESKALINQGIRDLVAAASSPANPPMMK